MFGSYVRVRADVVDIPSFSVHADHGELVSWLGSATRQPDTAYLVHGEPDALSALHDAIEDRLDWEAVVARHLERVRLA
jgi:metallo-beta-lactamase family protein